MLGWAGLVAAPQISHDSLLARSAWEGERASLSLSLGLSAGFSRQWEDGLTRPVGPVPGGSPSAFIHHLSGQVGGEQNQAAVLPVAPPRTLRERRCGDVSLGSMVGDPTRWAKPVQARTWRSERHLRAGAGTRSQRDLDPGSDRPAGADLCSPASAFSTCTTLHVHALSHAISP